MNHGLHLAFVHIIRIEQALQGKEAHLYLLRCREARGVVEGYVAAVGNHAVDKRQLVHIEAQRTVAFVEVGAFCRRKVGNHLVHDVVFVHRNYR